MQEPVKLLGLDESRFVLLFRDVNNNETEQVMVGTISNDQIMFGPPTVFATGMEAFHDSAEAILTDTEFVIVHRKFDPDAPQQGGVTLGRIAGDNISFTPVHVFASEKTFYLDVARLTDSRFLILYSAGVNVEVSNGIIGEVSNAGFIFGPKRCFHEARTRFRVDSLTPTKCIVAFSDSGNQSFGKAKIAEIN